MKRLVLLGVVLALVCAAAGSAAPPSVNAIAAAREKVALRKAGKLLRRIELPPGAVRLHRIPIHDLGMTTPEASVSIDTMSARRHGFWRTRQPVAWVIAFAEAHPVPGLTRNGGGRYRDGSQYLQFFGHGSPMQRMVSVSVVRAKGWTFIRLDAATAWTYPRSPKEALPAGVHQIDIRGAGISRHLSDPAQVTQVVHWFAALSVTPPHAYTVGCQVVISRPVTFLFRAAGGDVLARAVVPSGPAGYCDPIQFYLHGKQQTPLIDATTTKDAFVSRVERLLGVCFGAGPSAGKDSPTCRKQWAKEKAAQLLRQFRLPAGARALAREPRGDGGLLRTPESVPGTAELVDLHRFWKVRLTLAAAEAFVRREHHARQTGSGTVGGPGVPPNSSVTFTYVPRNGLVASRALEVTLVTLPRGWTGIRADAQVVWIYPRALFAPPARTGVVIDVRTGSATRRVTDYRTLERITFRFDRLQVVQPGTVYHCPAIIGGRQRVTVVFHGVDPTVTARAVASGTGISGPCNPIVFSAHGRVVRLVGRDFVPWLEGVLGMRSGAVRPSVNAIAAARRHAAALAARRLLGEFAPPPGARLIHGRPHDYGRYQGVGGPGAEYVDTHHFWIGHSDLPTIVSFEKAHVPAGFVFSGGEPNAAGTQTELWFSSPARGVATRMVAVWISQRKTRTIVRADAQVVWIYPRSPQEAVPSGVREIDVRTRSISRRVTDPEQIAKIVGWFDRLPIWPPGVGGASCGASLSGDYTLVFRSGAGAVVATAQGPVRRAGLCGEIDFSIHGKRQTRLVDAYRGESFAFRLQHLLGVKLG